MLPPERELEFLKFLDRLSTHLKQMRDAQKTLRHALRDTREFFHATQGCLAIVQEDRRDASLLFAIPKNADWDLDVLARFIRHERPPIQPDMIVAPLRRRGGAWAALAFVRADSPYEPHEGRLLMRIAAAISEAIQLMDRERMLGVRDRIDRKIMSQVHPKDVFYQILDGLRSLTRYDHSSAILIRESGNGALELVAEQIAWTKAKSQRIGLRRALTPDMQMLLESGQTYGFDRRGDRWHEWTGKPVERLAELLDYNGDGSIAEDLREQSILCAPLVTREGVFGILKVAACNPGSLTPYDAELVDHFRSQAAVAIDVLNRTESLQARMLTAERKHAMAELARSVAHDVNNALGSVLPLVQQMQDDVRRRQPDLTTWADDLQQIQKSLQVCRRIFGGMLSFARGGARRGRYGHIRTASDTVLAILKSGIDRRGINLVVDIADDLPPVACAQSDLEQVLLNLLTNAREASPQGGHLTLRAKPNGDVVHISIADTGSGIASENLPKVLEPFFTTKANGNGLGLTICRTILWEAGGSINIQSEAGKGTCVEVAIPRVAVPHQPIEA